MVRNPAIGIKVPSDREREMLFLTAGQTVCSQPLPQVPVGIRRIDHLPRVEWAAAERGGRALRHSSVDRSRGRVIVSEAATEVGGELVYGPTKTHRACTVFVARSAVGVLPDAVPTKDGHMPIFSTPRHDPLRSSNLRRAVWLSARTTRSEIYPAMSGLRVHDLATRLPASRSTPEEASRPFSGSSDT